ADLAGAVERRVDVHVEPARLQGSPLGVGQRHGAGPAEGAAGARDGARVERDDDGAGGSGRSRVDVRGDRPAAQVLHAHRVAERVVGVQREAGLAGGRGSADRRGGDLLGRVERGRVEEGRGGLLGRVEGRRAVCERAEAEGAANAAAVTRLVALGIDLTVAAERPAVDGRGRRRGGGGGRDDGRRRGRYRGGGGDGRRRRRGGGGRGGRRRRRGGGRSRGARCRRASGGSGGRRGRGGGRHRGARVVLARSRPDVLHAMLVNFISLTLLSHACVYVHF